METKKKKKTEILGKVCSETVCHYLNTGSRWVQKMEFKADFEKEEVKMWDFSLEDLRTVVEGTQ